MQIIINVNEDEDTATVGRREEIQPSARTEGEGSRPSSSDAEFEGEQLIDTGGPPEAVQKVTDSETVRTPSSTGERSSSYPGTMIDEFGEEQLGSALTERSGEHGIDIGSAPSLRKRENTETRSP